MVFRLNPCYKPMFDYRRGRGLLIVTKRFILATGIFANVWKY